MAHYATGLIYRSQDQVAAAIQEWEKAALLDPSRKDLRDVAIQQYFHRGEFQKAAALLEQATRHEPNSFLAWFLLAYAYRSDKQWERAEESAEKAIEIEPDRLPAYELLFEIGYERGDYKMSRKVLDRTMRQESADAQYWLRVADLHQLLAAKAPASALGKEQISALYERAGALQPDDPAVLARIADFHETSGNPRKSLEIYEQILKQAPDADHIRIKIAGTHVLLDEKKQAIGILEEVAMREPRRFPQIFMVIGDLYDELKDDERALANYRSSLKANPDQLPPYLRIVLLEMRNKRTSEALKQLSVARDRFPTASSVSFFYGLAYSDAKEYNRAVESFEEAQRMAVTSSPEMLDGVFYFYYGAALERNGQFDKAVEQFNKALEMNPDYADACNYLGYMYADKNIHIEEAATLVERALAFEPDNGAFLDSMGWILFRQGRFPEALLVLQRAAELIGNDAVIFDHLGDVHAKLGNPAEALANYKKSAEIDPKNSEVSRKLEDLQHSPSSVPGLERSIEREPRPTRKRRPTPSE